MRFWRIHFFIFRDVGLLEGAGVGFVDHCLVGSDVDFDAAVLGTTFGCSVGCNVILHGETFGVETVGSYARVEQVGAYGVGTTGGNALVDLECTGVIGEAVDLYVGVGVADK